MNGLWPSLAPGLVFALVTFGLGSLFAPTIGNFILEPLYVYRDSRRELSKMLLLHLADLDNPRRMDDKERHETAAYLWQFAASFTTAAGSIRGSGFLRLTGLLRSEVQIQTITRVVREISENLHDGKPGNSFKNAKWLLRTFNRCFEMAPETFFEELRDCPPDQYTPAA
jgi:hypothetical protein